MEFRRQVPVGGFIVDFLAPAARLVLEVDGAYHLRRSAADRDRKLRRAGYHVLRVDAALVTGNLAAAVALVTRELQRLAAP